MCEFVLTTVLFTMVVIIVSCIIGIRAKRGTLEAYLPALPILLGFAVLIASIFQVPSLKGAAQPISKQIQEVNKGLALLNPEAMEKFLAAEEKLREYLEVNRPSLEKAYEIVYFAVDDWNDKINLVLQKVCSPNEPCKSVEIGISTYSYVKENFSQGDYVLYWPGEKIEISKITGPMKEALKDYGSLKGDSVASSENLSKISLTDVAQNQKSILESLKKMSQPTDLTQMGDIQGFAHDIEQALMKRTLEAYNLEASGKDPNSVKLEIRELSALLNGFKSWMPVLCSGEELVEAKNPEVVEPVESQVVLTNFKANPADFIEAAEVKTE